MPTESAGLAAPLTIPVTPSSSSTPAAEKSPLPDHGHWFAREVEPHEPKLRAWLHSRFPSLRDQDDIIQEAYLKLLGARNTGRIRYVKAFLFTTARNAALDFFRKRRTHPVEEMTDFRESCSLAEQPDAAEITSQRQEFEILVEAVRALPERCRQVITFRYFEGLSDKEIAARLDISPETVKVHMAKGKRRCVDYFRERGLVESSAGKLHTGT